MRWPSPAGGALAITLALAAAAHAAHADPAPDPAAELADCEGLPPRGQIARVEPLGEDALFVVARSGARFVVFPAGDGNDCAVLPLARPAARVTGAFGGGAVEVCALRPARCAPGSCTVALVTRGKGGAERPLAALRTEASCDEGVALSAIKLFPGRDSAQLVCRASAGAGWQERRLLVDAAPGAIAPLYSLDTGSYIALSPDEKKAGQCPSQPVGAIRVERVAERPVLRVIDPAAGALHDGKGTLPARQLAWDPKRGEFLPTGAPDVPTPVNARACKR